MLFARALRARFSGAPFFVSSVRLYAVSGLARFALLREDSREGREPGALGSSAYVAFDAAWLFARPHLALRGFLALTLLAAVAFERLVDRPAIALSRRAGAVRLQAA